MSSIVDSQFSLDGESLDFIDLFAGLGGFHLALRKLGHRCVFASEMDDTLRKLYRENFGLLPAGNIRVVKISDVPPHNILCAGFPCQPFSKAGVQAGTECPKWGDLFDYVLRILRAKRPLYLILENVPNLERHHNGTTWGAMRRELETLGYHVDAKKLSPHQFGIPQIRERIFIVGCLRGLQGFRWPSTEGWRQPSILGFIDKNPPDARPLTPQVTRCLETWQEFIQAFPKSEELPSFPIWAMEFRATYPYEEMTPFSYGERRLGAFRGSFGLLLSRLPSAARMAALPSHARTQEWVFPEWKVQFIRQNRELYARHRKWIDKWLPRIRIFPSSLQKFEWNCRGEERDIWRYVIQFRASGVRVKRPTTSPSLIAMTSTQVPIVGWERRYLTPRECARLQSMQDLPNLPESSTRAFKALGNAVNVDLVCLIAANLLGQASHIEPFLSASIRHSDHPAPQNMLALVNSGGGQ